MAASEGTTTRKVREQATGETAVADEVNAIEAPIQKGEVKMAEAKKDVQVSSKSRLVALLLNFFLGWAGGHRFYTNKVGTGLMMLFTMGGFGMWYFLDLIMIASGNFKDRDNLPVTNWS